MKNTSPGYLRFRKAVGLVLYLFLSAYGFAGVVPSVQNRLAHPDDPSSAAERTSPAVAPTSGGAQAIAPGFEIQEGTFGYSFSAGAPDYLFGDQILPPLTDVNGDELAPESIATYWRSAPVAPGELVRTDKEGNSTVPVPDLENGGEDPRFYYSPHSDQVIASYAGGVEIVWVTAEPLEEGNFGILKRQYTIATGSKLPARRIYWTEGSFTGPSVQVPNGLVQSVNVLYNNVIPFNVTPEEVVQPEGTSASELPTTTFWYDNDQDQFFAYNREGKVLVEYLGALNGPEGSAQREVLGIELVDVRRELRAVPFATWLGEQILPSGNGLDVAPEVGLSPIQVDALTLGESFVQNHFIQGKTIFHAVRENLVPDRVRFYWTEPGQLSIRWPKYLNSYPIVWPESLDDFPAIFLRPDDLALGGGAPVVFPNNNTPELVFQDDQAGAEAAIDPSQRFTVELGDDNINRTLVRFQAGSDFWYVRVYAATDEILNDRDGTPGIDLTFPATVAERIDPPASADSIAGYIDPAFGTAYNIGAYIDPFAEGGITAAETGSIIPVNALPGNDQLRVWWFSRIDPPAGLEESFEPIFFPSISVDYTISYPSSPSTIVLASSDGTRALPADQASGSIYVQNDPALHGYNPNEEHALMIAGTGYALRDDLNRPGVSSEPYVLINYEEDLRPAMRAFRVLRETALNPLGRYTARAGVEIRGPMPLPILGKPLLPDGRTRNTEVTPITEDPSANDTLPHYDSFTFEDRKGELWVYRGPHDTASNPEPEIGMQWYYKTQESFAFPDASGEDQAPLIGTIVPYLREPTEDPITGDALTITYLPVWPESVPELRFAETLVQPKFGLPQIAGNTSIELLYEQSLSPSELSPRSVVLHDSTREKSFALKKAGQGLDAIPTSIATTQSRGNTYFQLLPSHLQERIYMDPLRGDYGELVFRGEFFDEPAGEDYLLPNVLSDQDVADLQDLCLPGDERESDWDTAVISLATNVEKFIESTTVPGTYVVGSSRPIGSQDTAELIHQDEAADSYTITATGGGEGYVVIATGNGEAFTPEEEPVSLKVFRVGGGLYRGELKPLVAANPLSENVTVQHTGDFAGDPGDFEFQWRSAPPVNGLAPGVTSFDAGTVPTLNLQWDIFGGFFPNHQVTLPRELSIIDTFQSRDTPELRLSASIDIAAAIAPTPADPRASKLDALYASILLEDADGVILLVNGVQTVAFRAGLTIPDSVPATGLSSDLEAQLPPASDGYITFEIPTSALELDGSDLFELSYNTTAEPNTLSRLDFRLTFMKEADDTGATYPILKVDDVGQNRFLVAGSGIDTLGDNYYIMRYRPLEGHSLYPAGGFSDDDTGWSEWTRPALVEGWIKRVLAGINPFNQKLSDFFENAIDTDVSVITQAGTRWEGDIALTLDAVADAGLIEIYETVLKRGIDLSIEGTPEVDYAPANDALLLAAGYLNDLYMAVGNEAFADAANPTIAFDNQSLNSIAIPSVATNFDDVFKNTATARFAFQGQVASLIDEELALLRGRDDSLQPSVQVAPAYNRIYWNYTRGIDAGEVFYALNYNITEKDGDDADGVIDAEDAQRAFPQAHGDAYGHYLTALKNYYRLLTDEQFSWGTRIEAVNVLGQPVSIDYLDERKFATAAVATSRTANQVLSLQRRKAEENAGLGGWEHLDDGRVSSAGSIRRWGVSDWASRGGQGTYFNWIVANSILPADDTENEGIQKIDRTTVPELNELASTGNLIQRQLDAANARVNPLDLTDDDLLFDISPQALADGDTHFEQVYDRAVAALGNAQSVFARATDSTRLIRSLETQGQDINNAVVDQERSYFDELTAIFGTPYPSDIGPGRTYPEGYEGPDLYRSFYIDRPFEIFTESDLFASSKETRQFSVLVNDEDVSLGRSKDQFQTMKKHYSDWKRFSTAPPTYPLRRGVRGRFIIPSR